MSDNNNKPSLVMIFYPCVMLICIAFVVEFFFTEIVCMRDMQTFSGNSLEELMLQMQNDVASPTISALMSIVYSVIGICWFSREYIKLRDKNKTIGQAISALSNNIVFTIAGILVTVIGLYYVTTYMSDALATAFPSWLIEYEELLDSAGIGNDMTPLMIAYALILGPICEELTFRGLTLKYARFHMPAVAAVVLQAVLFGAFHMNMLQGSYACVMGLVLGYVMYKYDNILVTIVMHMLYNIVGTLLSVFMPFGGETIAEFFGWFLGSLVVTYFGILLLKKGAKGVNNETMTSDN